MRNIDMILFQKKESKLHSGVVSDFKIECDALTYEDIECLAYLISKRIKFREVYGIPTGGNRLEAALKKYCDPDTLPILIVDDVLTTGVSMNNYRGTFEDQNIQGVVIFARGECPSWITPIFQMTI